MKSRIVIILGCVFFTGFYAGAERLPDSAVQQDSAVQPESAAQSNPVVQPDAASKTDTSVFQMSEVEVDKPRRNGFATLYLSPFYSFDFRELGLSVSTGYGVVFGGSAIAPAGIFEGRLGVDGVFFKGAWAVAVNIGKEINILKNDGINKLIPGLRLNVGIGYVDNSRDKYYIMPNVVLLDQTCCQTSSKDEYYTMSDIAHYDSPSRVNTDEFNILVGVGVYLKAFVSKQFALVPSLGVSYRQNLGVRTSAAKLNLDIELGLRQYF